MTLHVKRNGAWVGGDPYVKRGGQWRQGQEVYVKRNGIWTLGYQYDTAPPSGPILEVFAIQNRYLRIGVRMPQTAHQTDIARIRVLQGNTAFPASPQSSGAWETPDATYPFETWSDFWYNGSNAAGNHPNTAQMIYKENPPNPSSTYQMARGKNYYFSAWAQDKAGNWSSVANVVFYVPKAGQNFTIYQKRTARFLPIDVGIIRSNQAAGTSGSFIRGQGQINQNPYDDIGLFYGNQMINQVSKNVLGFGVSLWREATDPGPAQANVWASWFRYVDGASQGYYVPKASRFEQTKLGVIAKGEAKYFALPTAWFNDLGAAVQGIAISTQGSGTLGTDRFYAKSQADQPQQGILLGTWANE